MAIVQNPIVGRAKGSVSNNTFTKWKGKNIWKSKPLEVSNPQTDSQMRNRAKFQFMVHLAKLIGLLIRKGFKELAIGKTEFNVFQSKNLLNQFLSWNGTAWVPDYSKLVVSQGSLDDTSFTVSGVTNGGTTITVNYDNTASGNQSVGDSCYMLVVTPDDTKINAGLKLRSDGSNAITLDTALATGNVVHIYTFFVSADGKKSSDSQYVTVTV